MAGEDQALVDQRSAAERIWESRRLFTLVNIRDIAFILLLIVIALKILDADLLINFGEFSFNDLLALLLAFFSVGLSALFYFKADEASSKFYNNNYAYTKQMSEVLERIEGSFGERLTAIRERVFQLPIAELKQGVQRSSEDVVERQEIMTILEDRLSKANLVDQTQKDELLQLIEASKKQLQAASQRLETMDATLDKLDSNKSVERQDFDSKRRSNIHRVRVSFKIDADAVRIAQKIDPILDPEFTMTEIASALEAAGVEPPVLEDLVANPNGKDQVRHNFLTVKGYPMVGLLRVGTALRSLREEKK